MPALPDKVEIKEEGPREGFQIESADIPTMRKIELIEALAETGLKYIQIVSFVNPKRVPGMADADEVVAGFRPKNGVNYMALWLNDKGFRRAVAAGKLHLEGKLTLYASDAFLMRNQNRTQAQQIAAQPELIKLYQDHGVPVRTGFITAAFGCNFEGDVSTQKVISLVANLRNVAADHGEKLEVIGLGDTMAWANPESIKRIVGAVQDANPDIDISLHLHDTRGLGLANAFAGLQMGVRHFDAAVGGLGGCPFAKHRGAAGNIATEDFVLMCHEMGVETGIDLEKLIDCAALAEDIVGHPLPGAVKSGGSLNAMRARIHGDS